VICHDRGGARAGERTGEVASHRYQDADDHRGDAEALDGAADEVNGVVEVHLPGLPVPGPS